MHIVIISRLIYPYAVGGAEIHTYYTSRMLAERHNVTIVTTYRPLMSRNFKKSEEYFPKVKFIRTSSVPLLSSVCFIMKGFAVLLTMRKKVDIIHCHQAFASSILGLLLHFIKHSPFIITCHGSETRVGKKNPLLKIVQRLAMSKSSHVTCVSKDIAVILQRDYGIPKNKIAIIPNGYSVDSINKAKQESLKKKKNKEVKLTYVGSLRSEKDPQTLLEGFKNVSTKMSDIKLNVIGDGPLRSQLEHYCKNTSLSSKVFFRGILSHEEALKQIATSDIFVMTSVEEGLPTALIEAMALGKPVIATSVGGISEILKDGVNGLLIPPRSPEHVTRTLEKLATDPSLRRRLGAAATESVRDYSWTKIVKVYEVIYETVMSSKKE